MRFRRWATKSDIEYYRWMNEIRAECDKFNRKAAVVLFIIGMAAVITVIVGLVRGV